MVGGVGVGARRAVIERRVGNAAVATLALLLVSSIMTQSGRIADNKGYGFDGTIYARMMVNTLRAGSDNARMRPLVLLTNQLAYDFVFKEPIRTFQALNLVYTTLLALVLCGILDLYGASLAHKVIFTANVFATVAIAKMFAFYPVLIDLGAYFWVALAVWAILRGGRWLIVAATILAVLAREFGLVAIAFGVHRDLRRRVPLFVVAATYLPALASFVALRQWVFATSGTAGQLSGIQGGLLSGADLLSNLAYLVDPLFLVFLAYFVMTVFGGISMLLVLRAVRGRLSLRGETEWLTYFGAVGMLTAFGNIDLWRYLAYGVPAAAAVYAMTFATSDWRIVAPWAALVTVFTQQPWVTMNDVSYFRDWFPLYLPEFNVPEAPTPGFWVAWAVRIGGVASLAALVWAAHQAGPLAAAAAETPSQAAV
jgi:hypothetical protein